VCEEELETNESEGVDFLAELLELVWWSQVNDEETEKDLSWLWSWWWFEILCSTRSVLSNKHCWTLWPTGTFISTKGQKRWGGGSTGCRPRSLFVPYSQDKLISSRHPE
jgi:hypothetical protein